MFHSVRILDELYIGLTGLMVGTERERTDLGQHSTVHRQLLEDLRDKCGKCWPVEGPYTGAVSTRLCPDISEQTPGVAPPPAFEWCNADPRPAPGRGSYLDRCYALWERHYEGLGKAKPAESREL